MSSPLLISRFTPLAPIAVVLLILVGLEVALEWRHYGRCFDTPIFGSKDCGNNVLASEVESGEVTSATMPESTPRFGPIADWPFRSLVPSSEPVERTVVWIASASHAEHSRIAPDLVFPNLVCDALVTSDAQCLVVNGSRAGFSIKKNIELLEQAPDAAIPKVAVLYQMATFLASWQRKIADGIVRGASEETLLLTEESGYQKALAALSREFQSTSLYLHLSQFVSSPIKLASFREQQLPGALDAYLDEVRRFVDYCQKHDILPVLTTFAIAYNDNNFQSAPRSLQMTFVRENRTLSLEGYVQTVAELNVALGEFASQKGLPLVDLAVVVGGRSELFVDLVHFNPKGHRLIAETLAADLEGPLNEVRSAP